MGDKYTEYEHTGFLGNLGNSFGNMIFGFILFLASFVLLWWNEGRAVDRYITLETGQKNLIQTEKFDPKNDGKLVYISGDMEMAESPLDSEFNITNDKAVKILRRVEMYQWKESERTETEKNFGGSKTKKTTYSYDKVWSESHINSESFNEKYKDQHKNPSSKEPSRNFYAKNVKVKGYKLNDSQINMLESLKDMSVPQSAKFPEKMASKAKNNSSFIYVSRSGNSSLDNPELGDYKITFQYLPAGKVSVIGEQRDGGFTEYKTETGKLLEVREGNLKSKEIFQKATSENQTFTWILRGVGLLVMTIGLAMCASPLQALVDVVPFIGSIVGAITGFFALIISLALSSITIAIAWMAHRPMLSVAVAGGGVAIWLLLRMTQKPKTQRA